jgi:hypothetical protein
MVDTLVKSLSSLVRERQTLQRKGQQLGVLPDWTAHRGDVRCGGRPHGESSTEGGRTACV